MKFRWLMVACCALSFAACSSEDIATEEEGTEMTTPEVPEGVVFRDFVTLEAQTTEGSTSGSSVDADASRAPENVDENGRPKGVYPLDYMYIVTANPKQQPSSGESGAIDLDLQYYGHKKFDINGSFTLTFGKDPNYTVDPEGKYTDKGTIWIKVPGGEAVPMDLSVVKRESLGKDRISLNDFVYDTDYTDTPRGSSLYYTSYDVLINEKDDDSSWYKYPYSDDETAYNLWLDMRKTYNPDYIDTHEVKQLNTEFGDKLFAGKELVAFGLDDNIYVYLVERSGLSAGYNFQYFFDTTGGIQKNYIKMSRLTAAVNASFTIINGYAEGCNNQTSVDELFDRLKVAIGHDLRGMDCPYATLDGLCNRFNPNMIGSDNTKRVDDGGRLLLWNKKTENANKVANVSYSLQNGQNMEVGVGILGNAHAFVFRCDELESYALSFWVNLPEKYNAWIRIDAVLPDGIQLDENANTQLVALVPAEDLKEVLDKLLASPRQSLSRSGEKAMVSMTVPAIVK